jgi:hypothetical protein
MYTNAQYMTDLLGDVASIRVDINGVPSFVPIDTMNGDYNEIMRLVDAGELIIAPAS